jgi:hypothetical protein
MQWVVKGALDVDSLIGANPSAEGGEEEGADDQAAKVVDIVDTFRLQVSNPLCPLVLSLVVLFRNSPSSSLNVSV